MSIFPLPIFLNSPQIKSPKQNSSILPSHTGVLFLERNFYVIIDREKRKEIRKRGFVLKKRKGGGKRVAKKRKKKGR